MKVQDLHSIYQLRTELRGIQPPIWRRLVMLNSINLAEIHFYFQCAMGWKDCHLHQFVCNDIAYGTSEEMENETGYRISQVLKKIGESLLYEYDFGDGWQLEVKLERISLFDIDRELPLCVGGRRAAPPEDIGGIPGYEMCLQALANRDDPENEEVLDSIAEDFDPEYFDENDVNDGLRGAGKACSA